MKAIDASAKARRLDGAASPSEWTVAQVLSHLGSAAVITKRRLEDGLTNQDTPDDLAGPYWRPGTQRSPWRTATMRWKPTTR
jgi:hypothetical protein